MATSRALGIDFGTSNSAAAYLEGDTPKLIRLAGTQSVVPTTFFFDFDTRQTLIGAPANQALIDGVEGRFMRALKRVLGTSMMHEKRQILSQRVTFIDIIGRFLRHIKTSAENATGHPFYEVVSGRPVFFHGAGDPREAQAEADLRECYAAAGFRSVRFVPEPEAAALASAGGEDTAQLGLIVDIGGGTSDFSLFQYEGGAVHILANNGVRIGGTDFDRAISLQHVMPLLGRDTYLRKEMGAGRLKTPNAIYSDLATWEKIPFVYSSQNLRLARDMMQLAEAPEKLRRLFTVLESELGHDVAFAVERGKIDANSDGAEALIRLNEVEPNLAAPLSDQNMALDLKPFAAELETGARKTLELANVHATEVDRVVYVGGSSLMSLVPDTMRAVFPTAEHVFSEVFTAVTHGLAIATRE